MARKEKNDGGRARSGGREASREPPKAGTHRPFENLRDLLPPAPAAAGPVPARRRAAAPGRTEGDEEAFRRAMSGVDRAERRGPAGRAAGPPAPPPEDEFALAERFLASFVDGEVSFDLADTDEYVEGSVCGLDPRIVRRLRAGEFAVQAHMDLHGMDRVSAKREVRRFVEECQTAGKRCVLVVHGRGLGSKDHVPVLKRHLRDWLSRGGIGRRVLAFTSARPCDGGTGAAYVLLRRLREG